MYFVKRINLEVLKYFICSVSLLTLFMFYLKIYKTFKCFTEV